jgi:hypothetical protein
VVYIAGTLGAATLFSDNGVTPLANPFLSSTTGRIDFYAANGRYDVVVSKVGFLSVTISDIELDDLMAPSGSNSVGYLPAGTGAVTTTVQTKLRESVSVKDFGATGNGVADDTAAIQAAINYIGLAGGGTVRLPKGVYLTTSTLTIDYISVELVGDGGLSVNYPLVLGSAGVVGQGQHTGATRIFASFTSGPVVRVKKSSCALIELCVDGSEARRLAALSTNYGVWLEAADSVGEQTNRFYMHRCRITNQPSHGVVMVNSMVSSRLDMVDIDNIWGHGIYISGGVLSSRTNKERPGLVQLNLCRISRNGGHSILVGGNDTLALDIPYRVEIQNMEGFFNGIVAANLISSASAYISGESHHIKDSAFSGNTEFPSVDVYSSLFLRGSYIHIDNMRAINANPYAIEIAGHPGLANISQSILIQNLYISNTFRGAGFYNPAVFYTSSARNVQVQSSDLYSSTVTTLSSMAAGSFSYEEYNNSSNNDRANNRRSAAVSGFSSYAGTPVVPGNITFAADTAAYIEFTAGAQGVIIISGSAAARGAGVVFFRVGSAGHSTLLSSAGATVSVGTGTLSTGVVDGIPGSLNVYANTATNRLYIKNRTAATGSYGYTLLNIQPGIYAANLLII